MKKFYIKQLENLQDKIENLMEQFGPFKKSAKVVGRIPAVASAKTVSQKVALLGKDPLAKYGNLLDPNQKSIADMSKQAASDAEGWIEFLTKEWNSFIDTIKDFFNDVKDTLKGTSFGKWIFDTYEKIEEQLIKVYNTVSKEVTRLWENADFWQKITFYVGVIFMLLTCAYISITDPGAALNKIWNSVKTSLNKSGDIIVEGSKKLISGKVSALVNIVLEILLAPLKAIYGALESAADTGILTALTLCLGFISASMGILYYRVTNVQLKGADKAAEAAAKGASKGA